MSTTFNGDVVINGPVTITISGDALKINAEDLNNEVEVEDSDDDIVKRMFGHVMRDEEDDEEQDEESCSGFGCCDDDDEEEGEETKGFLRFLDGLWEDGEEEEIVTVADADIIKAIHACENDFVFDTGADSQVHCWKIFDDEANPDFICNLGIAGLRMALHEKFNMRLDVALTKEVAIKLRDFLTNLDLCD